jgi:hypothetical protein
MARKVEEPTFTTVIDDGNIEVREYPACVVAETEVTGDWDKASSAGFRRLAGYIFGGNRGSARIAMTAPVGQRQLGQKIAMTAPVGVRPDGEAWIVSFTMPSGSVLYAMPTPNDELVRLRELPGRRVAVIQFTGFWTASSMATRTEALQSWMARRGLHAAGPPEINRYDPPWTLPWLRRNEVWIPVQTENEQPLRDGPIGP